MEQETQETRVRLNLSQNAKGFVQFDVTSEFPTLEESSKNLSLAIDEVKKIVEEKGLKLAGE